MTKVPRASLSIGILDDEDFDRLIDREDGTEIFGVFVCILIAGRERLGRDRAVQIGHTDALRFDDSVRHVLKKAHVTQEQLDRALAALAEVAEATRSKPWLYLDKEGRLVIKSFFKFNTSAGWGGTREGAGRKSSGNQDDSDLNQLDSGSAEIKIQGDPTRKVSFTSTVSGTGSVTATDAPAGEPPEVVAENSGEPKGNRRDIIQAPTRELIENRGPGKDSPEAIGLEKRLRPLGKDPDGNAYAVWAREMCYYAPVAWLEALCDQKVRGVQNRPRVAYLRTILGGWLTSGECSMLGSSRNAKPREPPRADLPVHRAPANSKYRNP